MVTIIREPAPEMTVGDLIIGSFGVVGLSMVVALVIGAAIGGWLVLWHRIHPPPWRSMPPVSPLLPGAGDPPSSQAR